MAIAEGWGKRRVEKKNEIISGAWLTAALNRQERLPKLDSLLHKEERKPQTVDDMVAMARLFTLAYGGEVVEV